MIIAVLGDIHGNYLALKEVLNDIQKEGIGHLLISGDIVGYYYHPDKVFDELARWSYELIQGNHDYMFGRIYRGDQKFGEWYKQKYGNGIEIALEVLNQKTCEFLSELPTKKEINIGGRNILLCHGSPWNPDEYIYPDSPESIVKRCAKDHFDVIIMGHTHYPMVKHINSTVIINPGSVGQPRNNIPGADWAILDLNTLDVQLKHVQYDISAVAEEAKRIDPELPYLAQVLFRKMTNSLFDIGCD